MHDESSGHSGGKTHVFHLVFTDKLTKEEEEIYKLQHDLERTAITQQLNQKVSEVRSFFFFLFYCNR